MLGFCCNDAHLEEIVRWFSLFVAKRLVLGYLGSMDYFTPIQVGCFRPVTSLQTNLLTSYDHFHGHPSIADVSFLHRPFADHSARVPATSILALPPSPSSGGNISW